MIIVAGIMRIPLKDVERVTAAMPDMIKATREEPGCLGYTFSWDVEEPNVLRVFEMFENIEALQTHRMSAHMRAWLNVSGHCVRDLNRYESTLLPKV